MNRLNLYNQELTELTESDLMLFCDLNNIEYNKLEYLHLNNNELKNINFIKKNTPFINLKELYLNDNYELKSINNIKYLVNLEYLSIAYLNINEKETVKILKTMSKLITLDCRYTFRNYIKQQLKLELPNIKKINNG